MRPNNTPWPDERVVQLKALWGKGFSASQIARQIGGITRNSVIGKLHRMGMSARSEPSRPSAMPEPKALKAPPKPKAVKANPTPRKPPPAMEPVPSAGVALFDLSFWHCRHPVNDWPRGYGERARFCGEYAGDGPYCQHHAAMNSGGAPQPKPKGIQGYDQHNRRAA